MTCSNKCPDCDCTPDAASTTDGELELQENTISYKVGNDPVLVIDQEGMIYKGVRVRDAGEAYAAFMATMSALQTIPKVQDTGSSCYPESALLYRSTVDEAEADAMIGGVETINRVLDQTS